MSGAQGNLSTPGSQQPGLDGRLREDGESRRGLDDVELDGAALDRRIALLSRRAAQLSFLRLATFGTAAAGVYEALEGKPWGWAVAAASLPAFAVLVAVHGRLLERRDRAATRRTLIEEAVARQNPIPRRRPSPRLAASGSPLEQGLRIFAQEPATHEIDDATADDIGLFDSETSATSDSPGEVGRRTLFGLLDWTSTRFGALRLRRMLAHPLRFERDVLVRQEAVVECARKDRPREEVLAAFAALRRQDFTRVPRCLGLVGAFAGRKGLLLLANLLGTLCPACWLLAALLPSWSWVAPGFLTGLFNFAIIAIQSKRSNPARDRILALGPLLAGLARVDAALEGAQFNAEAWREVAGTLQGLRGRAASLRRHVALLSGSSYGVFFEVWNVITLWELRILPVADASFASARGELERGAGALGEAEALLSLALPLAEDRRFEMPRVISGLSPRVEARECLHPLLSTDGAVANPVKLDEATNVLIVTGSNMAGKSTYLKSIALNVALAGAGGPICGKGFEWTPIALHSDMNVRDSLDDGRSYFQVEVDRVQRTLRAASSSPFILALFDELFRGTNSEERIAIARAVVRHLRSKGILLVVATHDAALTRLVTDEHEPGCANSHFEESVGDGVLRFDYRLRPGSATTRNAIRVLEAQGYPEEIVRDARAQAEARK